MQLGPLPPAHLLLPAIVVIIAIINAYDICVCVLHYVLNIIIIIKLNKIKNKCEKNIHTYIKYHFL